MRLLRGLCVLVLTLGVAVLIRLFVRWLASKLGGGSGDLVGVLNVFAFLVAGGAVAAFSRRFKSGTPGVVSHLTTVALTLLLFFMGPWLEYRSWIKRVASEQGMNRDTAVAATDGFLKADAGTAGFIGFYRYTARHTRVSEEATRSKDRLWITETLNFLKYGFYLAVALWAAIFSLRTVTDTTDIGLAVLLTLFSGDD